MRYHNIKLGCDPEVFLTNANGELVSSIGLIGGTKEKPLDVGNGYFLQEDNVTLEFNIPPCGSLVDWKANMKHILDLIEKTLKKDQLSMLVRASVVMPKEALADPRSWEFGCDPDWNAYTLRRNKQPDCETQLRTAAGHVHIGYDDPDEESRVNLIRAMDVFTGVGSVLINEDESTVERMRLYGNPGAYRSKPYGVEYRTLPNFWIQNEQLVEWVWTQTNKAISFLNSGRLIEDGDFEEIKFAIKNQDRHISEEIVKKYNVMPVI